MEGGLAETAHVAVRVGYFLPGDLPFHGFQPFEFRGDAFPESRVITSLMARMCGAGDPQHRRSLRAAGSSNAPDRLTHTLPVPMWGGWLAG